MDHTTPTGGPPRSHTVGATRRLGRRPRRPPTQSRVRTGAAACCAEIERPRTAPSDPPEANPTTPTPTHQPAPAAPNAHQQPPALPERRDQPTDGRCWRHVHHDTGAAGTPQIARLRPEPERTKRLLEEQATPTGQCWPSADEHQGGSSSGRPTMRKTAPTSGTKTLNRNDSVCCTTACGSPAARRGPPYTDGGPLR